MHSFANRWWIIWRRKWQSTPVSCTFYRVNFMICELDSNLKIVIDRGFFFFFFKNSHKKHILSWVLFGSHPSKVCRQTNIWTGMRSQVSSFRDWLLWASLHHQTTRILSLCRSCSPCSYPPLSFSSPCSDGLPPSSSASWVQSGLLSAALLLGSWPPSDCSPSALPFAFSLW